MLKNTISKMSEQHFNIKTKNSEFAVELFGIDNGLYSEEICEMLGDVVVYNVTLLNISGINKDFVDIGSFKSICVELIRFLKNNPNSILYYYCDDMHNVPRNRTGKTPQEFRSKLFKAFFKRYVGYDENLICLDITGETFEDDETHKKEVFIHLILPSSLETLARKFGDEIRSIFIA